jgi:hypothetical protein
MHRILAGALALASLSLSVLAQQVNPAHSAESSAQGEQQAPSDPRLRSWEMPPTVVRASPGALREEDLIGSYGQPRWTARRLFPTTRVYVRPEGEFAVEYWTRVKVPRDGGPTTVETEYEVEVGLPGRFQIDLYHVTSKTGREGELDTAEQKYELRYALADWGELWMNPAVYFEYVSRDSEVDKVEYKLLLGDELGEGWHFGSNLVLEHELGGVGENEYGLTLGLARTLIDETFSLGAEVKAALLDESADRGDYTKELEIGPSLRWMPLPQMHVDFAPLVGIGPDSRGADIFLVIGWEL